MQRLVIGGKSCTLGLGSYALVSLAEAREQALSNRKLAHSGGYPLADKRRAQAMPAFEGTAAEVLAQKRVGGHNEKHASDSPTGLRL